MSGGSWEYVYRTFADTAERLSEEKAPERKALGELVHRVADALHAIEWVDSADFSPGDELPRIENALGPNASAHILAVAVEQLRRQIKEAEALLNKYEALK